MPVGSGGALSRIRGMFKLRGEGTSAPNFRMSLQVLSSPQLNNTLVTCANTVNQNDNQTA